MRVVKIGAVTDVHQSPREDMRGHMRRFVDDMNNNFLPDLVVELGDFIDGGKVDERVEEEELRKINEVYAQCKAPRYYVMGNHDLVNVSRSRFKEIVGIDYNWTSITVDFIHIIFLDGVGGLEYTTPSLLGHIPEEELDWLRKDLEKIPADQPIIVFCHYPIRLYRFFGVRGGLNNEEELMRTFEGYNLIATFGGHYPGLGGYKEFRGVHHISLSNIRASYAKITITPTEIRVDEDDARIHLMLRYKNKRV